MSLPALASLRRRTYHLLLKAHLTALQRVVGTRPIPLSYWRAVARVSGVRFSYELTLSPLLYEPRGPSTEFAASELRTLFAGRTLGSWALDVATVDHVWRELQSQQPGLVIECGAGSSTHLFAAHFQQRAHSRPTVPSVVSLEQDREIAREIEEELRQAARGEHARVLFTPLDRESSYSVDADAILAALAGRRADWVFIDGPAGRPGCRWRTLLDLMPYARPGARWFLDDALRCEELDVLSLWAHHPRIRVDGIIPIGKGLATGIIDPAGARLS